MQAEVIDVIQGEARLINSKTVSVDGREINARRYLLCTGARPSIPPIDGLADVDYLTYETIWGLDELPLRLAVVGGGPIGCEIAQAFCRLGSSVSLVEGADRIMLQDEPEAAEVVAQKTGTGRRGPKDQRAVATGRKNRQGSPLVPSWRRSSGSR